MGTASDLLKVRAEDWAVFLFIALLLIFAIPTINEQIKKFFGTVGLVSAKVIKKNEYERRMDKIEGDIMQLSNDIKTLNKGVQDLTNMLSDHIEKYRENNVAVLRNSLWNIYREATELGYITNEGLKTFIELGKVYEECGGDDIYHDKLHPTVMDLEVK